jgi:Xaa-Pro aminopeptidase
MIVSNEPGYYRVGAYGIRIENLLLVQKREIDGAEREMRGFETLTLAPIDLSLVETSLMSAQEIAWLDAYHTRVWEAVAPLVSEETRAWLEEATRPLRQSSRKPGGLSGTQNRAVRT